MKKSIKIFLGVAGVLALIGVCFLCLSIYAKKEINKPKFELPETGTEQAAFPLPATKDEAFERVSALFEEAASADDSEITRHTDVHTTEGERILPFSDDDNAVLSRVLELSQGALGGLYPSDEGALASKIENRPALGFTKADVTDFTAVKGTVSESGEEVDDGNYYITLTVNPSALDAKAMQESEIRKNIEKELSSVLKVSSLEIAPEGFTATFRIRYSDGRLMYTELKHSVRLKAGVDFEGDYKKLSSETAQLEIPYETVECIDFFRYGVHFNERQLAIQKKDMKALPLEVNVNAEATKDEYKLSFDVSRDGILEIDEDGVVNVKGSDKEPLTVTATLEYDGHTYKDELTVYATEMEVKTDEPQGN